MKEKNPGKKIGSQSCVGPGSQALWASLMSTT